ncbi:COPII coat Sec23p-Sfb3p heterodimer component [Actinomortierella ambigua]|nr:COPII coat Sec23p-Sfb3p heterodimer component [Actinomortierella ambigua]
MSAPPQHPYPQQQQHQQRPHFHPGQPQHGPNGMQQQQQQNKPPMNPGVRPPGPPGPHHPAMRPMNPAGPGARPPMQQGPGGPVRPSVNGAPHPQQQQHQQPPPPQQQGHAQPPMQQQQRPGMPPGARPPQPQMGPRPPMPMNAARTASPLPGQTPPPPGHGAPGQPHPFQQQQQQQQQQPAHQTPTPIGTPGSAPFHAQSPPSQQQSQQFPPKPAQQQQGPPPQQYQQHPGHLQNATPLGQNAPMGQGPSPHAGHQRQESTPPTDPNGANGMYDQMANMSLGQHAPNEHPLPAVPGPPAQQQQQPEAKPKPGARAKRVYATDSAGASSPGGSFGGMPAAQPMQQQQQPPYPGAPAATPGYGAQSFSPMGNAVPNQGMAQAAPGYAQQQQQPLPPLPGQGMPPAPQPYQHAPATQPYQQAPVGQQPYQAQHQQPAAPRPQQQAQPQAGNRPRLDPDQIPSPVTVQEADQVEWDEKPFITSSRTSATPLASTDFVATDGGNCNPKFFRMTTYNIPSTEDLLSTSQLPMGLIIQPLAQLRPDEAPIETVDFGEAGPARCRRCKAYINPYMIFTDGGRRFVCNMCLFENEIDPNYFCNLDMNGRRCDLDQRPELRNGTIEFAVPKEYWSKTPMAAAYVFAIDVSWNSIQSGMLSQTVQGIKEAIWDENGQSRLAPGVQIGILTYDKNVHFYNLSASLEQAQMMVVPDVNDVFVPLSDGFLVNPETSQQVVGSLLDTLPQLFAENKTTEPVIGAVVQAVRMALENRGGKLILFQTALPTYGPGALKHREDSKLYGTDKERQLYAPQDDFYKKLAESCVDAGLSIDLFMFPNAYMDVATLGCLPSITGGETFFYPHFHASRDGFKLRGNIARLVQRPFGFNALMRVRCSAGLRIAEHFGNLHMKNSTDVELAGLDSEKAYGVLVKHEGKLDEKTEASFQVALLYTTADGRRRVRVHNFSTPVASLLGNVFRWADMDTTINFLSKGAVAQALSRPMNEVRDALTDKCVKILSAYRKNCASSTAPGQLILPESFKLFPLYALSMLKSKPLRSGGKGINSDMRVHQMRMLKSMGVSESIVFFYPRMFDLHNLTAEMGSMDHTGKVRLPRLVRVSYARLSPQGAYLLENGQNAWLWLGRECDGQFLQDVFGVSALEQVDITQRELPVLETATSMQLRAIVNYVQSQRGKCLGLTLVRQGLDQLELEFSEQLVEDKNNEAMSYVDYLCQIHRMIQTEVTTRPHEVPTNFWTSR